MKKEQMPSPEEMQKLSNQNKAYQEGMEELNDMKSVNENEKDEVRDFITEKVVNNYAKQSGEKNEQQVEKEMQEIISKVRAIRDLIRQVDIYEKQNNTMLDSSSRAKKTFLYLGPNSGTTPKENPYYFAVNLSENIADTEYYLEEPTFERSFNGISFNDAVLDLTNQNQSEEFLDKFYSEREKVGKESGGDRPEWIKIQKEKIDILKKILADCISKIDTNKLDDFLDNRYKCFQALSKGDKEKAESYDQNMPKLPQPKIDDSKHLV